MVRNSTAHIAQLQCSAMLHLERPLPRGLESVLCHRQPSPARCTRRRDYACSRSGMVGRSLAADHRESCRRV